jgi:hypothetical protein
MCDLGCCSVTILMLLPLPQLEITTPSQFPSFLDHKLDLHRGALSIPISMDGKLEENNVFSANPNKRVTTALISDSEVMCTSSERSYDLNSHSGTASPGSDPPAPAVIANQRRNAVTAPSATALMRVEDLAHHISVFLVNAMSPPQISWYPGSRRSM